MNGDDLRIRAAAELELRRRREAREAEAASVAQPAQAAPVAAAAPEPTPQRPRPLEKAARAYRFVTGAPYDLASGVAQGASEFGQSWAGLGELADPEGRTPVGRASGAASRLIEYEDPDLGFFGKIGRLGSRVVLEGAAGLGAGTLVRSGLRRYAPRLGAPVIAALESPSRAVRGAATMGVSAPFDVAQGLQYEEGMLLPGRGGSVAENLAISGLAGTLLPAAKRVGAVAEEVPAGPITDPARLIAAPRPAAEAVAPATPARSIRRTPETIEGPLEVAGVRDAGGLDQVRVATGPRQPPKEETLFGRVAEEKISGLPSVLESPLRGIYEAWNKAYTKIFDSNAPILTVAKSAGKGTAEKLDNYIAVGAGYGKAAEQLVADQLAPIVRELYEIGGDDLLQKARQAAIVRRAASSNLNIGMSPEQIRSALSEINTDPVLRDATDRLHNFFRSLLEERKTWGLISETDYDAIIKSDDYYTPFMVDYLTLGKNPNAKAGGNWNVTDKGVRSIIRDPNFERDFAITDPFEVAVSQAVTTMRDVGRARVMQLIDELVDSPLGNQFIRRKKFNPAMPMGSTENTFQAIVNGKKVAYEVTDQDLLRSIAGQSDLSQNVLWGISRKLAAVKRGGIVAPPDFALLNMLRDMSAYAIQRTDTGRALTEAGIGAVAGMGIGAATAGEDDDLFKRVLISGSIGAGLGMSARPAAQILEAVGDIVGNKDIYKEWLRQGGSSEGFYIRQSPKEANKILRAMKQAGISMSDVITPSRWYDALMFIGSVAEQAPRLARAKTVVGGDLAAATPDMWAQAIKEGQDISVRFARKGGSKLTRDVASITPFWNAQLQGWVKVGQMVTNPRVAAQAGAIITAPSIALWYVNKDNPEYWERPQWERDLFWLVPKGEGGFYRVPKPFQIGTIFATLPERLFSYMAETGQISSAAPIRKLDPSEAAFEALKVAAIDPVAEIRPIPAVVDLALSQWVNKDFFTGREIVPQAYRGLPGEMQATPRTSAIARAFGSTTGFSPLRADKLIRDIAGTGGTRISEAVIDPAMRAAGFEAPVQRARDIGTGAAFRRTTGLQRFVTKEYDATETEYVARQRLDDLQKVNRGLTNLINEGQSDSKIDAYITKNMRALEEYDALNENRIALDRITARRREVSRRRDITPQERDRILDDLKNLGEDVARATIEYGARR